MVTGFDAFDFFYDDSELTLNFNGGLDHRDLLKIALCQNLLHPLRSVALYVSPRQLKQTIQIQGVHILAWLDGIDLLIERHSSVC
ncbi:hypothetical protein D3C71_1553780 [compost metagenome]